MSNTNIKSEFFVVGFYCYFSVRRGVYVGFYGDFSLIAVRFVFENLFVEQVYVITVVGLADSRKRKYSRSRSSDRRAATVSLTVFHIHESADFFGALT